jgi:DNA-binding NarL/FixJ family response regulator
MLRSMAIRVVLVDDIGDYRRLVRIALRARGGFVVVGEAADGRSAVEEVRRTQPDVVVLDLGLPDLPGAEVISGVRDASPDSAVVVFSGTELHDAHVLRQQVEAYVVKTGDVDFLVDLLAELGGGEAGQSLSLHLARDLRSAREARAAVRSACLEWGCEEAMEAALIIASELVTNAVVHGESECEFRMLRTDRRLRLEAEDHGGGSPDIRLAANGDENGRGLLLVSALSSAWGIESVPVGRKRVWAEVQLLSDAG